MPNELRNKVTEFALEGVPSAGSVLLVDERWHRRPVGIVALPGHAAAPLLSARYYLERALDPVTQLRTGSVSELLERPLAVLIFTDGGPQPADAAKIRRWVAAGGMLLRFAGPLLADGRALPDRDSGANPDAREGGLALPGDRLLPVQLRRGGRTLGGALSWERPATLAPFSPHSPFAGLAVPSDVRVLRQVLAEPDTGLDSKIWARLADGTPLVTAARMGRGWIVLVHTTANASWSNLAISGLFVEMLRRIVAMSEGVASVGGAALAPLETLDGFGQLGRPPPTARPISVRGAARPRVSPQHPPGFYGSAEARRALNLWSATGALRPIADLPPGIKPEDIAASGEIALGPPLLAAAAALALIDLLLAYALRGLLWRRRRRFAAAILLALSLAAQNARADDAFDGNAAARLHLAYVVTGDEEVDRISRAGLAGLGLTLDARTAVDPGAPQAIDIERDPLAFFPLIYWPVTANEPPPSPQAAARIDHYLETGGTILIDTRDGAGGTLGPFGGAGEPRLRRLLAGVRIPPLVPIPPDHILTKSFYLLHEFPGRWNGGTLWVEPARGRVNDGVSSVILGDNDWAAAWAVDAEGRPMLPVVPGGAVQREMARRFGVNLVMYVLTGNYKNDQLQVPEILRRLGR